LSASVAVVVMVVWVQVQVAERALVLLELVVAEVGQR
jgi:hypothetical protein